MNNLQALEKLKQSAKEQTKELESSITEIHEKNSKDLLENLKVTHSKRSKNLENSIQAMQEKLEKQLTNLHENKLEKIEELIEERLQQSTTLKIILTAILTAIIVSVTNYFLITKRIWIVEKDQQEVEKEWLIPKEKRVIIQGDRYIMELEKRAVTHQEKVYIRMDN